MLTLSAGTGILEVSEVLVNEVAQFSARMALLTAETLTALGLSSQQSDHRFPAWFLQELGATQQICVWELSGLSDHFADSLPSYDAAVAEVVRRCLNPDCHDNQEGRTPLSLRVLQVWLNSTSWSAPEILGAELHFSPEGEDEAVERWAQFLFDNRHVLTAMLRRSEEGV